MKCKRLKKIFEFFIKTIAPTLFNYILINVKILIKRHITSRFPYEGIENTFHCIQV